MGSLYSLYESDLLALDEPEVKLDTYWCLECGGIEIWKWGGPHGIPDNFISNLGRMCKVSTNKYLPGHVNSEGYHTFKYTTNEGWSKRKDANTLIGIAFCGIKIVYGSERTEDTMDHKNRNRLDNRLCCNLVSATKREQSINQDRKEFNQGKTIIGIGRYEEIVREYVSRHHAAYELEVCPGTIDNRIKSGKVYKGIILRYLDKNDLSLQVWRSSKELYPEFYPFEVSDQGYVKRQNGTIFKGSKHGDYMKISLINKKTGKTVNKYVHILVWTIFNNRLVRKGYVISHKLSKGTDNRLSNLEESTQSDNIITTINNGLSSNCNPIRRNHYDGTYKDYVSVSTAARDNKEVYKDRITRAARNGTQLGKCNCDEFYTWEFLKKEVKEKFSTLDNPLISKNKPTVLMVVEEITKTKKKEYKPKNPYGRKGVRKHFHDGTYEDFQSQKAGYNSTKDLSGPYLLKSLNGKESFSGTCMCGKQL